MCSDSTYFTDRCTGTSELSSLFDTTILSENFLTSLGIEPVSLRS